MERTLELTVLAVPDCPNAPELERRLAEALADQPAVTIARHLISSAAEAARWQMHGIADEIDGRSKKLHVPIEPVHAH